MLLSKRTPIADVGCFSLGIAHRVKAYTVSRSRANTDSAALCQQMTALSYSSRDQQGERPPYLGACSATDTIKDPLHCSSCWRPPLPRSVTSMGAWSERVPASMCNMVCNTVMSQQMTAVGAAGAGTCTKNSTGHHSPIALAVGHLLHLSLHTSTMAIHPVLLLQSTVIYAIIGNVTVPWHHPVRRGTKKSMLLTFDIAPRTI